MTECDVLIIGGGPAGATLAWALRRQGRDVHLLDKARYPRDKVCAGWITPAVISELELDLEDYARDQLLQPVHGFRVSLMGGREIEADYHGEPISYGIRRCEFDHYLLRRSGAVIHEGVAVKSIERDGDGYLVNGEYRCRLLVGAGGHFCPVARHVFGARPGAGELAVRAQEIEFRMSPAQARDCPVDPQMPELFFCEDLKGYGWVVRKGDYLNIGLGREDNHRLAEHVKRFCEALAAAGKIPAALPGRFQGHAYLLYPHARRELVRDGAMLVGDAAGLAYPQSGEGIRPAIESALIAAAVIGACEGAYPATALAAYAEKLQAHLGTREQRTFTDRLPEWLVRFLGQKLLGMRWFIRHMVMDRWFLHRQTPPLRMDSAVSRD